MRLHAVSRVLLLAAAAGPCAGCFSTWDIPIKDVDHLHGFRAPTAQVVTHDADGDEVTVDENTELRFHIGPAVPDLRAKFDAIDVHKAPGEWWLNAVLHGDGQPLRVDLREVVKVSAKRYSPGKTAIAAAVPVAVVVVAIGVTLGLVIASIPSD